MKLSKEQKRQLEQLIASGDKLEAIKQFRNMADVGLSEARAFIESMEASGGGHRASAHEAAPRNLRQAEQAALAAIREGNVMEAIKRYQKHSRLGLKEVKDAIDALVVVHRTDGRVNPKLAAAVIRMVRSGEKDNALIQIMSQTGYDETEALALLKSLGGMGLGGASLGAGCLRIFLGLILLAGLAFALLIWAAGQAQ